MKDFDLLGHVADLFKFYPKPWAVAGGWAIDLSLNQVTRSHRDIDLLERT